VSKIKTSNIFLKRRVLFEIAEDDFLLLTIQPCSRESIIFKGRKSTTTRYIIH